MTVRTTAAGLAQADSSKGHWGESLRRIETSSGTQVCGEETNLETAVKFLPRPTGQLSIGSLAPAIPAKMAPFIIGTENQGYTDDNKHSRPTRKPTRWRAISSPSIEHCDCMGEA